jgi:putative holliday junction resolvase
MKNTKILGIDYGRRKVGFAVAYGSISEPLQVTRYEDFAVLVEGIKKIIEKENVTKVVIGVSEGDMAKETREFGKRLEKEIFVPVETFDETLTSKDAQALSIEAGVPQKKRHQMEDAYAAAIMLQNYLDSGR